MKNRFTLPDVIASVTEINKLVGMRVNNVYDIDNKTYLIKLSRTDEKAVILFESGVRFHQTFHDWPKSQMPSSFSMKLRKHINQKRLSSARVVGFDRLVELTFGTEERENKLLIELYDRGNVILTDNEYTILNILRVRTDKDTSVRWAVREKYTFSAANNKDAIDSIDIDEEVRKIPNGKEEQLVRVLAGVTKCGNPITKEILIRCGLKPEMKLKENCEYLNDVREKLEDVKEMTKQIWRQVEENPVGFISYTEKTSIVDNSICEVYQDFNPIEMKCASNSKSFSSFSEAVDEFYSRIETQKQEQKAMNMEKQALKKLENVEKDQKERIEALVVAQEEREKMANLIIMNTERVERALLLVRTALANQLSWSTIDEMRQSAAAKGDPVAKSIVSFQFENNQFVMQLGDPYDDEEDVMKVPIDISMNASKNAQRYFVDKKQAAQKVQKTVASSGKAIKNAQEKAKSTLDQVRVVAEVKKTRKAMWFEKFRWFISSEGYIVVAGRDAQQNELLVKKYLRPGDVYVHADVRGASSVIIRNKNNGGEIPPKTLTEASQMAVCYSNAWEANVTASAWWVYHHQVSRTAPTGEYLPSGSFMIRGKKNFMPPSQLVMGLGIMFKLDDESAEKHRTAESEDNVIQTEENKNNETDGDEATEEFPDVQVQIGRADDEEVTMIEVGPTNVKSKQQPVKKETEVYLEEKKQMELKNMQPSLRTQKRKQRKEKLAKQKYKDHTEDDLLLHKELLKPHGDKPKEAEVEDKPVKRKEVMNEKPKAEEPQRQPKNQENEDDDDIEEDKEASMEEQAMLSTLTCKPFDDDTLLFAIPVVAPYTSLSTFKYRVKITPGTGKRGKATKSAIELFTRNKTDRQSALIKSLLSDDAASRNLPTKVRVSAPQLHAK